MGSSQGGLTQNNKLPPILTLIIRLFSSILILVSIYGVWTLIPDIVWQYLFFLRAPIFWGLFVIALPLISISIVPSMLKNLFVMRGPWQLFFVVIITNMVGIGIITNAYMIFKNSSVRFGVEPLAIPQVWEYSLIVVGFFIILLFAVLPGLEKQEKEDEQEKENDQGSGGLFNEQNGTILILSVILGITFASFLLFIKSYAITVLWLCLVGLGLSTPIVFNCYQLTRKDFKYNGLSTKLNKLSFVAAMIVVVFVIPLALIGLQQWIFNGSISGELITAIHNITQNLTVGYIDDNDQLRTGHLLNIAFFLLAFFLYSSIGFFYKPTLDPNQKEAAALMFLMLIIMMIAPLSGSLTFFLDHYHLPLLLPFLFFVALMYWLWQVDHFFFLDDLPANSATKDLQQIMKERLDKFQDQDPDKGKTLVVIGASGGGIQAAGWIVEVLTGLQKMLGEGFAQRIGLISSVSGGSVGTMYYLDSFNRDKGCPEGEELEHKIFDNSTKDSLDAVGWGLAYPDLRRITGFPFLVSEKKDRGQAIEVNWKANIKDSKTAFSNWKNDIYQGTIPIPIFNATLVEDGRRFLMSPIPSENLNLNNVVDFQTLFPEKDIKIVTAARLSATFSYVTPICRNQGNRPDDNYHIADGGYFDNSGVVTMLEWLSELLQFRKDLNIKRVLLLEINAFPEPERTQDETVGGWWQVIIGPFLALFKVRNVTQLSRVESETRLFQKRWHNEEDHPVNIAYCPIYFKPDGTYNPPLSWNLTEKQKDEIKKGWEGIEQKVAETIGTEINNEWEIWGFDEPKSNKETTD